MAEISLSYFSEPLRSQSQGFYNFAVKPDEYCSGYQESDEQRQPIFRMILATIQPPSQPPYSDDVISFVRNLRLRGLAGFGRTMSRIGEHERTIALFEAARRDKDFPFSKEPEVPELLPISAEKASIRSA